MWLEIVSLISLLAILGMSVYLSITYIQLKESVRAMEATLPTVAPIQTNMPTLVGQVPASPKIATQPAAPATATAPAPAPAPAAVPPTTTTSTPTATIPTSAPPKILTATTAPRQQTWTEAPSPVVQRPVMTVVGPAQLNPDYQGPIFETNVEGIDKAVAIPSMRPPVTSSNVPAMVAPATSTTK